MPPILQARLLGEFSLICDGSPVPATLTGRSQALLAYLLLNRHTPQPRQRLAFHLWSESTEPQARTNLRKELSHLRRALPNAEQILSVDAKTLQWQPKTQFTLDVAQFEEAIKAAQATDSSLAQAALEQAVELYRGDLLPDCDDEWIIPERDRLQQMRVRALEQLINLLEEQRAYRIALGYGQQLLQFDRLNESTYCVLMRLHNLSGDRANALQLYHRCMIILREELGIDPSPTTQKLYEQLLREDELPEDELPAQTTTHFRPLTLLHPALSPLVGRKREWEIIRQWMGAIDSAASSEVLLLLGEPGIGKTRLLEELREVMQSGRMQGHILWGRAFAAEMVRPYGIWIDALRSLELPPVTLSPKLGFLLPEIDQPIIDPPDRSHLFDAVMQLLAEWANQSPLVVILDDIQWIDEASSALLHYAIRLLNHLPVQFACTARTGELEANAEVSRVVQALRRERRLQTLELPAFNREETAELIRSVSGNALDLSLEVVDQVFIDSGGNPLFTLELARASTPNQSVQADTLEALIGDRLRQLNDTAYDLLPWAAALGRSFKPTMVAQVADYPLAQLLLSIEQLEQRSIIRPSTSIGNEMGYDFSHDIVRQVVYRQLSEPRRRLIHLQIAHQLNQRTTPDHALAGDIAHHAALGGDPELAAATALLAAERCLKLFAYAEASKLAQQGMHHSQQLDNSSRVRLQIGLLKCYISAGVTKEQVPQIEATLHQLIAEAIALNLKDEEAIALEALIALSYDYNNLTSVHQHALRAAERVRSASPAVMARMLAHSGWCLAEIERDMDRAEALLLEAQSLAARVELEICDIACGLGCVHRHAADFTEAHLLLEQAWHMAQAEQDHWRECACLSYLAMVQLETGHPARAIAYSTELATVATKISGEGSEGAMAVALTALANYQLQQPNQLQQPEAEVALEQAIATLQQIDAKRMLAYVLIGAAEVDLVSERFAMAAIRAEAALQSAQIMNQPSETALAWAVLIQSFLAAGELDRAIAQFQAPHRPTDRHALSTRAQTAVDRVIMQCRKIKEGETHGSRPG
ncbi:MAG: AAA family ATPase [Timaviella obliquedivisa GSE-PSE-MK23-08B]|jgi:DNA-binding SARP family transcriptional activator|nr:AAA family ATPase [Timaviella obliquedivisa GSE-PSE-MK23-08B]